MRKINKAYRCQDKSTDILSFPAPQEMKKLGFLGELIICYPVLENQAQAFAHSVQDELDILLVHGVLHLIGMDHEQSIKEARFMAKWERKILIQFSTQKELGLIGRSSSGTV